MRELATAERIRRFIDELGRIATSRSTMYLTGGATAVLLEWRDSTIDVDIKLVPETDELLRSIPSLKERLQINVELASPDHFIPVKPGWEDRSPFEAREGLLSFHHFDLYAQALAKIERGHSQDVADVQEMLKRGLVERDGLRAYFAAIEPLLYRYPALDAGSFRQALEDALRLPSP